MDGWRKYIGYALAGFGLLWVLHDIQPVELVRRIAIRHWLFVPAAVGADIVSYIVQAFRWRVLLTPVGELPIAEAIRAIYAGLFFNEILPLRPGELVRAGLASRSLSVRIRAVLPSIALERLMDGIWLTAAIGVSTVLIPLPTEMVRASWMLATALSIAILLLIILVFRNRGVTPGHFISEVIHGLRQTTKSRHFWRALWISSLVLFFQASAFWFAMVAYGLGFPLWRGIVVYLILHLGTALPNAPSNVGSFQFFTVLALTLFGVEKATAAAFSMVAFAVLTIPLWIIGFAALTRTGLTIAGVRSHVRRV